MALLTEMNMQILIAAVALLYILVVILFITKKEGMTNDTYKVMYQAERSDQDANTTLDQRVSGWNVELNENLVGGREFPSFWEPSAAVSSRNLTNTSAAQPLTATVKSAVPAPTQVVSPFRGGMEHLENDKTTNDLMKSLNGN